MEFWIFGGGPISSMCIVCMCCCSLFNSLAPEHWAEEDSTIVIESILNRQYYFLSNTIIFSVTQWQTH